MNEQGDEPGLKRDPWIQTRPPGRRVRTSHQPNADKFCYHSSLTASSAGKHIIELFVSVLGERLLKKLLTITKNRPQAEILRKATNGNYTSVLSWSTEKPESQTHIPLHHWWGQNHDTANTPQRHYYNRGFNISAYKLVSYAVSPCLALLL